MEQLTDILTDATARIEGLYMRLPVDGGEGQYRERVYCYELYHQMRSLWPDPCDYSLNGEVDKRGHPIIAALTAAMAIPDLLVHTPGSMQGNHAILEVKHANASRDGIRKDLRTLSRFRQNDIHYERAIYLFFGGVRMDRLTEVVGETEFAKLPPIEVWVHEQAGAPACRVTTFERPV